MFGFLVCIFEFPLVDTFVIERPVVSLFSLPSVQLRIGFAVAKQSCAFETFLALFSPFCFAYVTMKRRYYSVDHLNSRMRRLSVAAIARQRAVGVEDVIRDRMNKIRHWRLTSLGKKRPKWGFEFTVMSYNILSQNAVDSHMYLYRKCSPQFLTEEYRVSRLLPEILKSNSDIVCLQEVEQYLYDNRIKQVFDSNGFGSIFKKRTGSKSDGCAILWRRDKFRLLKHQAVEYRKHDCRILDRDNVGLIAVLRPCHPKAAEALLHVATTHLIFNPRRGDVKLCQLRVLLAELERLAFKELDDNGRAYHPAILCGDFNFEPYSPLYRFVDAGRLDIRGMVAGNMSGQEEGKDKGGKLFPDRMSLDAIGIDESGRYSVGGEASGSQQASEHQKDSGSAKKNEESCSNSRLHHYRLLKEMMNATQLNPKASPTRISDIDRGPSSNDSDSDSSSSDSEGPAELFYHDFNFVPAYKYNHQNPNNLPVTSITGNDFNTVDHIFYNVKEKFSTSFTEDRLKLLGTYSLPFAEDMKELDGLPNAHLGSDHLCLMSKFIIGFRH